mmetsp:Transcript_56316/g.122584  ORF Transcript_56316/g.122584 Transcript_56316/m.122584 type:complete len:119 (-) Transcript_56316:577-933(-)
MQAFLVLGFLASASAFVQPASPLQSLQKASVASSSPMMMEETSSRRAFLGAAVLGAALPASAYIPGLTGPGFQGQTKKGGGRPAFETIRDKTSFWSSKGIMDSVPKVNGIITPKTPVK